MAELLVDGDQQQLLLSHPDWSMPAYPQSIYPERGRVEERNKILRTDTQMNLGEKEIFKILFG